MNNLIINKKNVGHCSKPRTRGHGDNAYTYLMEDGYYITLEIRNINQFHAEYNKDGGIDYYFDLYK